MAELWDDSALITAFNSAIAKYKAMHGVTGENKTQDHEATENFVRMESDSHTGEPPIECEVESIELLQKEGNSHESSQQENEMPLLKAENLSSHGEGHVENNSVEGPPETAGYNGYAGSEYNTHHGHPATDENCYMCQWNAYYNQSGAWTAPATCGSNGLQCQYCGFVNQCGDSTNNHHQTPNVFQSSPDASTFPEIVRAAVAEALKAADGQNSSGDMMETSRTSTGFADVAVAWFLAGFHTSRYLSQGREQK